MPGRRVFHVEEVPGVLDGLKLSLTGMTRKKTGVFHRGVLIPITVDEQQRDFDGVSTGNVAVGVLGQHLIDVKMHLPVFVFVQAADMAFVETLEQLNRRIPAGEYLPILVLTADATRDTRLRALALGAKDFISKPLDALETMLRVWNLLETRALYKALRTLVPADQIELLRQLKPQPIS